MVRSALALLLVLFAVSASGAHPLAPSLLELREGTDGLEVTWKTPRRVASGARLEPVLPAHCRAAGERSLETSVSAIRWHQRIDCGEQGLVGAELSVRGLDASRTAAVVRLELADGRRVDGLLRRDAEVFPVPDPGEVTSVALRYGELGFRHILSGPDHLLFVLALLLLVRGARRLTATITAFTVGHSVTLCLAALGLLRVPVAPIELGIAMSLGVLAVELARPLAARTAGEPSSPGPVARRPWVVAGGFGLLHGLGFASALRETGLPGDAIPLALASFNVGIEIGQLAFAGVVLLVRAAVERSVSRTPRWLEATAIYGIGVAAFYWCWDRAAALVVG